MEKLKVGKIVNAVGLKGEVKVYPYTDGKEFFEEIDSLLLRNESGSEERRQIEHVRYMKDMAILKLDRIDDRTEAEKYKDALLFVLKEEAPALPEDTYYVKDLIGLSVRDENGACLGILKHVIKNVSQDLYEIEREDGQETFLLPAVKEFVRDVDLDRRTITVHLIEGILELRKGAK